MSTTNPYIRFSFLEQSQKHIHGNYDLSDKDFIRGETDHDVDITEVKKAAVDRVLDSMDIQKPYRDPIGRYTDEEQLLSYPIARVLVALTDNPFLYYLFSVNEARRFVNLSTQVESDVSMDRNVEAIEVDQQVLLSELGYSIDEEVPINLYQSIVPEEHIRTPNIIGKRALGSDTIEATSEVLDPLLLWAIVPEIRDGLKREVPEFLEDELESESIIIKQTIPDEFKVSKRGLAEEASYKSVGKLTEHLPPSLRESADSLVSNQPISEKKKSMVLRTLIDCGVGVDEINDWLEYGSKWTDSYGRDTLFDLQGDIQHEEYGFTSYTVSNLQEDGVLDNTGSIYRLTDYSPVYTVLKKNNQLYPGDNIRPPDSQV